MNDEAARCGWAGTGPDLPCDYHDTDWGVPEYDSRALWEKLVLGRVSGGAQLDHDP